MINLYYDKIIDNTPIPNGASNYTFTNDFRRLPIANSDGPVMPITAFYNAMISTGVTVSLYSGKETASNLFYPFELGLGLSWDVPLANHIPAKTLGRIKKGKMKLLRQELHMIIGHYGNCVYNWITLQLVEYNDIRYLLY
jgi:hypothetical protein